MYILNIYLLLFSLSNELRIFKRIKINKIIKTRSDKILLQITNNYQKIPISVSLSFLFAAENHFLFVAKMKAGHKIPFSISILWNLLPPSLLTARMQTCATVSFHFCASQSRWHKCLRSFLCLPDVPV